MNAVETPIKTDNIKLIKSIDPNHIVNIINNKTYLEFMYSIQSYLDINNIIKTVIKYINKDCVLTGASFINKSLENKIQIGSTGPVFLSYQLSTNTSKLGIINLFSNNNFTTKVIKQIEDILTLTIFPINNALAHHKAVESALEDPLTGVGNRLALAPALKREIELHKRYNSPLSILYLDLDYFKKINDLFGHPAGDCYLQGFAVKLTETVRDSDMVFRVGGEEFLTLLSKTDKEGAIKLANRIRIIVENFLCKYKSAVLKTTVSIGVAQFKHSDDCYKLQERADRALYKAKSLGRNTVCCF